MLRLKFPRLYSVERRCERFMIVYLFRMLYGFVPNIGLNENELKMTEPVYTSINQQLRRQQQPVSNK